MNQRRRGVEVSGEEKYAEHCIRKRERRIVGVEETGG